MSLKQAESDVGGPHFRKMKLEDIDDICAIEEEAFPTPWTAAAFYNELVYNHTAYYLVLEENEEVIGYGGMWLIADEAHITNVAIRRPERGRKLGERLMQQMQVVAAARGIKRMTLEVRVSNQVAQNLYKKMGFRPSGLRKGYYSDNHEDALIMWATLPENLSESRETM